MSDYFHCDLCDKSIKIKSKKKYLNSQYHKSLTRSIICKYTVKNPKFLHVEDILKNFVHDYNKKFEIYLIFFVNGNCTSRILSLISILIDYIILIVLVGI